jgi:Alr-MurF fusion protein
MAFKYSISEFIKIANAEVHGKTDDSIFINDILIDSRKFVAGNSTAFVAITTPANDGHNFIEDLYNKGVKVFIVSKLPKIIWEDSLFLLVKNTIDALQKISIYHRKKFNSLVIGITGSNGKTIVKEWLYQVLNPDYVIVRSPKSFNSQIGVPLSVLQMNDAANLSIFEAGISMPDEMDRIQKIILPNIGIFTNIGHAHDENFIDKRQKINEKIQLFKSSDVIIFCRDHVEINERLFSVENFKNKKLSSWSFKNKAADLYIRSSKDSKSNTYQCYYNDQEFDLTLPFSDEASVENIFHVALTALNLGVMPAVLQTRILALSSVEMRMELKAGINNCTIINDVYNSDLSSILIAIDFLAQQNQHNFKTIILSDIMQSGMNENTLYARVAEWVSKHDIQCFIGIGKALKRQHNLFKTEKYFYDSTDDFLQNHPIYTIANQSILLKGARVFEFERISNLLQQKAHQTVLEVNLTALVSNLNFYRSKLKAGTSIMAMVKAFSYGSGSFEIANALRYHNVDYLAVAYADEGVELRNSGIILPIMVMNPDENAFEMMIVNNLEPEIYSLGILKKLILSLKNSLIPENRKFGIHLKIDSGMNRLGFKKEEIPQVLELLNSENHIIVKSVFSHLVASDNPDFDDFTNFQANYFSESCDQIKNALHYNFLKHILNSAGICRFPQFHFDMVRLGIGLYGFGTCPQSEEKLSNVLTLKSIISQIKKLNIGDSVGYNRSYIAENEMLSATIPIGYADGFDRRFSNGVGSVFIRGQKCKVIGNVCMDMTMVDVSVINAQEGEEVLIFGNEFTVSNFAKLINTIPYEVMTSISVRVKRIYFHE